MTHGIIRVGTGGTSALTRSQIGSDITLPADGPWIIHGIWGQVIKRVTIPNQGTGGILELFSVQGDIDPNPAPAQFPLIGSPISESTDAAISTVPLNLWQTNYTAPGRATLRLFYTNDVAITTSPRVLCGILFGTEIPDQPRAPFCASILSASASAAETNMGTITLSQNATKIVGILADCGKVGAATAAEEIGATIRLSSDSINFQPAEFPCNRAYNASDGTAVGQSSTPQSQFIPVDIPAVGGAIITVFNTSTISVTGNIEVRVHILYQ